MKNKFIKIISLIAILSCSFLFFSSIVFASNSTKCSDKVCSSSTYPDSVKAACGCPATTTKDKFSVVIQNILSAVIAISGLVAVVFIIIGGINYMTSAGDPGKVKKAKDTILYALIGLIICALAFAIVNWTIGIVNNAEKNNTNTTSGP